MLLQIRNIAKVKNFQSQADLEKVIYALISSWKDYCNSLYLGLKQKVISRLQLIQNSAAKHLTNSSFITFSHLFLLYTLFYQVLRSIF